MSVWKIKVLNYGTIYELPKAAVTPGLDPEVFITGPYLGFLLQDGKRNILVDSGIGDDFIVDGKAWGGFKAEGGRAFVEKALQNAGLSPLDIDTVLYTHLHNDHAGNASLFKNARLVFQKEEWKTLLDPLPVMKLRRDYDESLASELRTMNCVMVDGDFEFTKGINCFKTPGHTPGSMSISVETPGGLRIMVGDHWHLDCMAFGWQDRMLDLEGNEEKITPAPPELGRFIPSSIIYNYFDYYDSCYKILAMMPEDKPEYVIPGHETRLLVYGV